MFQRPGVIPDDIKIITIDEENLDKLGPCSDLDRGYFADLIEILNKYEALAPRVIGIDVQFSGTNNSDADMRLVEVCGRYDNIVVASSVTFDSYLYQDSNGEYHTPKYVSEEAKPYDGVDKVVDFINQKHREKKTQLYFTEDDKRQLYLAAMLYDVGKMDIPLEVMDKSTKLGSREKDDELDTMTRILTIMDIYDPLIADDRPYKKPKSVKVAFEILDEEATAGKVDKELLEFAKELYMKDLDDVET